MKPINLNLVGCGGVGLKIARELQPYAEKIQSVTLWDSDRVEDRNLERQIFTKDQVGMSKSQATADLFFPEATVKEDMTETSLWDMGYTDKDNPWLDNTVWILATDNIESRLLLLRTFDDFAKEDSLVVSAANATADDGLGIGSTAWVYKLGFTGDKDPRIRHQMTTEDDINSGRPCTETSDPQTALANSGAAIRCVELLVQYSHDSLESFEKYLSTQHSLFWNQTSE